MRKIIISLLFLSVVLNGQLYSQEIKVDKLVELSDELYQMIRNDEFDQAKGLLKQIEKEWSSKGYSLSLNEARMFSLTFFELKETLTKVEISKEESLKRAIQFRLVTDTLQSDYQPLWKESKVKVLKQLKQCQKEVEKCTDFIETFELLLPAISLDVLEEQYVKLKSYVAFIEKLDENTPIKEYEEQLITIENELILLFDAQKENKMEPGFLYLIFIVGSFIIALLSYVGWKKYQGEKESRKKTEN